MTGTDAATEHLMKAREEGRFDEALRLLEDTLRNADEGMPKPGPSQFIAMFTWGQLLEHYPPARTALVALRDDYARRLLAGDDGFPSVNPYLRPSRFRVIVDMNEMLGDTHASYTLFVAMLARLPDLARRYAHAALPAIVAAGDFTLAERYLRNPLEELDELNRQAASLPSIAPPRAALRLETEVLIFVRDVRLHAQTLDGLGRGAEAAALREAAMTGIALDAVRALARRELADPGTIIREQTARQMAAHDEAR